MERPGKIQLGEFWPQAPNAWFAAAELKFEVANITVERERFADSVGAMGFSMLLAVMDLVEHPPAVDPFTTLKGRLDLAHQLTPVHTVCRRPQSAYMGRPEATSGHKTSWPLSWSSARLARRGQHSSGPPSP